MTVATLGALERHAVRGWSADLLFLTALWAVGILIVNPVGSFPLIDDFAYSRAVSTLLETGDYRPPGLPMMTLFTQVIWGALFCSPLGFGFTALRVSSLVAGLAGVIGLYVLVRELTVPRWLALLTALVLALCPPYYVLSFTFMTDVLFTALSIWSVVFFARSLRTGSGRQIVLGTGLAIAALLTRQVALAIPTAFAIGCLLRRDFSIPKSFRALGPLVVCVLALFTFNRWMEITGRTPLQYTQLSSIIWSNIWAPGSLVSELASYVFFAPIYIGLFLLPVFLASAEQLFLSNGMRQLWRTHRTWGITGSIGGALAVFLSWRYLVASQVETLVPQLSPGSQLGRAGVGPLLLRDQVVLHLYDHVANWPQALWIITTVLGLIGALLIIIKLSFHAADLLSRVMNAPRTLSTNETVGWFLIFCSLIYSVPLMLFKFYDRYLILMVAFLAVGLLAISGTTSERSPTSFVKLRLVAFLMLAAWGLISVAGTRDYMTWNRVRWQALGDLMKNNHVGPEKIDGGPEFDGLYFYDPHYKYDPPKSGWWVQDDTYQIGFGPVPGYAVIGEYSYQHWLPPHVQKLVVMKKIAPDPVKQSAVSK